MHSPKMRKPEDRFAGGWAQMGLLEWRDAVHGRGRMTSRICSEARQNTSKTLSALIRTNTSCTRSFAIPSRERSAASCSYWAIRWVRLVEPRKWDFRFVQFFAMASQHTLHGRRDAFPAAIDARRKNRSSLLRRLPGSKMGWMRGFRRSNATMGLPQVNFNRIPGLKQVLWSHAGKTSDNLCDTGHHHSVWPSFRNTGNF